MGGSFGAGRKGLAAALVLALAAALCAVLAIGPAGTMGVSEEPCMA